MKYLSNKNLIKALLIYWLILILAHHFFEFFLNVIVLNDNRISFVLWNKIFNWVVIIPSAVFIIIKIITWGNKKKF